MPTVFADAGYFIASLDARDALHERAADATRSLTPLEIVTTQMVLVEFLNYYSDAAEHHRSLAAQMVTDLVARSNVEIIPQTEAQFRAAVERYAARGDQTWSLTDCASFLVMEERGITEALAHDQDFEQAGFVALLRSNPDS